MAGDEARAPRAGFFDLLVRQRRAVYLAVAALSAAGVWAATRLPSAIYPELQFPRITVVAQGSALGARQMVFAVTRPLEQAVSLVPGVTRVRSRSIRGASEVNITFAAGADMGAALQQTQQRVTQALPDLPAGMNVQVERLTPSIFPILSYNLEGGDPAVLYDLARYQVAPALSRIPGVGRVDVQGSAVREIEVVADPVRLAGARITYDELAAAIRAGITPAVVGRVTRDHRQLLVVTDLEARSVADVEAVLVRPGLRVRDIAGVRPGVQDRVSIVAGNGRPAALINVSRQPGGNTVAVADSVATAVAALRAVLPPGAVLRPVYDQALLVRESVASVRDAMLIGAALAVLVLLVFLGDLRVTAVSATAIPLTMAITVLVMWLAGQSFNIMSLGAMAIAIGLVIDDAVVVVENVARHLALAGAAERDAAGRPFLSRRTALREAIAELVWPVTTSTLTTVVVFLPLGLLQGVVGQFFTTLSVTLTIAVLVSLVLALTLIPLLADQFVRQRSDVRPQAFAAAERERGGHRHLAASVQRGLARLERAYARTLDRAIAHPRLVLASVVALAVIGYATSRVTGTGFLPEMDEGAFVLDYWTPGSTALAETDRQIHVAERILMSTPDIEAISRRTGAELGLFATEQNRGDVVARLLPRAHRSRTIFAIMDDARARIATEAPRLRIEFIQILSDIINDLAGAASPVELKLYGDRLDELEAYARRLAPRLSAVPGVVDLYDGVSEPSAELLLRVHAEPASRIGLTPEAIGAAVASATLGAPAGELRTEDRAVPVRVRAPDAVRFDALGLANLPLRGGGPGAAVTPLAAVATLRDTTSRAELLRENQRQMIAVTAQVSGRALGPVMGDVRQVLAGEPPPRGVLVEIGGQYANQQESFRALALVLLLAGLSVITVMVVQFTSFVEPLVVALVAPVSFAGALALLLATGTPLNVSSLMGLILLVGLVVKNGIILLDFARHLMNERAMPLEAALREAGRVRLRPILMTTLCTLFGLLPLALGLGAGSELQRPLALAVIGGLALSTPITLLAVPTLVAAIHGARARRT